MEITDYQLKAVKSFFSLPVKILRKFFKSDDLTERRIFILTMSQQGHIRSLRTFNFFLDNIDVERPEDILLPTGEYLIEAFPKRFKTANNE